MKPMIGLMVFLGGFGVAQASPVLLAQGKWAMTAIITSPMPETIHYTAFNHGRAWGDWMMNRSPNQQCASHNRAADGRVKMTCHEQIPNGMTAVTHIHGQIFATHHGKALHGELSGATSIPGGIHAPFSETVSGQWQGQQ